MKHLLCGSVSLIYWQLNVNAVHRMTRAPLSREDLHSRIEIAITEQSNFTEMPCYLSKPVVWYQRSQCWEQAVCAFLFHSEKHIGHFHSRFWTVWYSQGVGWNLLPLSHCKTGSATQPMEKSLASCFRFQNPLLMNGPSSQCCTDLKTAGGDNLREVWAGVCEIEVKPNKNTQYHMLCRC